MVAAERHRRIDARCRRVLLRSSFLQRDFHFGCFCQPREVTGRNLYAKLATLIEFVRAVKRILKRYQVIIIDLKLI